jgi:hypothetical protein
MYSRQIGLLTVIGGMFIAALLVVPSASSAYKDKYKSDTNPGTTQPPNAPWVPLPAAPSLNVGQEIWIAVENIYVSSNVKDWWVEVVVPAGGATFEVSDWHGYYNGGASQSVTTLTSSEVVPGPPFKQRWNFRSNPQPSWEMVKVKRTTKGTAQVTVNIDGNSNCSYGGRTANDTVIIDSLWYGAPYDTVELTDIWIFHESTSVNTGIQPEIVPPPGTGPFTYEFVYTDPDSNPRPQGGIHWYTTGQGIGSWERYNIMFAMAGNPAGLYSFYTYDAVEDEYVRFVIPIGQVGVIPTLTEWGMIIFCALLLGWMAWVIVRRRKRVTIGA